jgi:hypothetical protein
MGNYLAGSKCQQKQRRDRSKSRIFESKRRVLVCWVKGSFTVLLALKKSARDLVTPLLAINESGKARLHCPLSVDHFKGFYCIGPMGRCADLFINRRHSHTHIIQFTFSNAFRL